MNLRGLLLALGAAAAVAGLLVVVRPSLAAGLSPGYIVVTIVGVIALVQAASVAVGRLRGVRSAADVDPVERTRAAPTPGASFDERLGELPYTSGRVADRERAAVRDQLREVTLETLTRYEGYDRERAERELDRGTWTENRQAATFFAPEIADSGLTDRLRNAVAADRAFVRRAQAVTAVLDERAGGHGRRANTSDVDRGREAER